MKKFLIGALLIATTTLFGGNTKVFANENEQNVTTEVVTFFENQNQINVGAIKNFAITNSNVIFNNNNVFSYNFETHLISKLNYENVTDIKQTQNYVVLKTNNQLKILKNNNEIELTDANFVCDNYNVYEKNDCLFISYTYNNKLNFVKINSKLEIENQISKDFSQNVVALCLNENYTFIITQNDSNFGLIKISNLTNATTPLTFNYLNCSQIEILEINNETYFLLVSHLNQTFTILKENNNEMNDITQKSTYGTQNPSFVLGEVSNFADVKVFNQNIYIADSINKNIQCFNLNNEQLVPTNVVVASKSFENGYFNDINDFSLVNSNTLLISDTFNNRLQLINNNEITTILKYNEQNIQSPKFYSTNDNINFWFYSNGKIVKQTENNFIEIPVGNNIADLKIDSLNNVYFLNYENKTLNIIKNNLTNSTVLISDLNINENSKLEILNNKTYLISNNNQISLYDNDKLLTSKTLENNVDDLEIDYYNNIYVLSNNTLTKIENNNNTLENETTLNYNFENISCFKVNKYNGEILCFDNNNQNFIKIKSNNFVNDLINFEHLFNSNNFEPTSTIINSGVILKDCYISNFPYNTEIKQQLNKNTKVFVLGEFENSYYIMINNNNTIDYGYIAKDNLQINKPQINEPQKVVVINKIIKLYKLPTILHDEDVSFAYSTAKLNEQLNVVNFELTSIDNSDYYAVKTNDNKILYVNASDVTLYGSVDILPLPDLNAEIITTNNEVIKLLSAPDENSSIIMELNNKQKIYVENFDANKQYTYITIITDDKQEISGYVETKYIKLNSTINPGLTSALIVLGVAFVILIISIIIYKKQKKDNE